MFDVWHSPKGIDIENDNGVLFPKLIWPTTIRSLLEITGTIYSISEKGPIFETGYFLKLFLEVFQINLKLKLEKIIGMQEKLENKWARKRKNTIV